MQKFPIWEYASDEEDVEGQDETWVRPVHATKISPNEYSQIVAAKFTTPSGQAFAGHMVVTPAASTPASLDHSGGALFVSKRQCFLVDPNGPALDFIKRDCMKGLKNALRKKPSEIFPMVFELLVLIRGEKQPRKGLFESPGKAQE